jgi:DNA-binding transcriptional ArsR family regulator
VIKESNLTGKHMSDTKKDKKGLEGHYSVKELSKILSISQSTLRYWLKLRLFEFVKVQAGKKKGKILIPESSIRSFLNANKIRPIKDLVNQILRE